MGFEWSVAQTKSNLDIFSDLIDSVLTEILPEIPKEPSTTLFIKNLDANSNISWFIENRIVHILKSLGFHDEIYVGDPDFSNRDGKTTLRLDYKVLDLKVKYMKREDGGFLGSGSNQINRQITVGLLVRVVKVPEDALILSEERWKNYNDWINEDQISTVENSNLPFTSGEFKYNKNSKNLLEPLLVTGVTGIIVFLFFSLRSR